MIYSYLYVSSQNGSILIWCLVTNSANDKLMDWVMVMIVVLVVVVMIMMVIQITGKIWLTDGTSTFRCK